MIFWALPNSGIKTASSLKELLCGFAEEHPDISVETSVKTPLSLWKNLFLCPQRPKDFTAPDLVQIPHHWTTLFARLGALHDLADIGLPVLEKEWPEAVFGHCFLAGSGRAYSVPWWMEFSVLHYRADFLDGICSDLEKKLSAWDGFTEVCGILAKKRRMPEEFRPLANSNQAGTVSVKDALPCVWNRGGELFSADMSRSAVNKEEVAEGIEDYLSLGREGYLPLMTEGGGGSNSLDGSTAGMQLSRRFRPFTGRRGKNPDIRTLPFPVSGGSGLLAGHNLAVVRDSPNIKDAVALLKWLSRPDVQLRYAQSIRAFPCGRQSLEELFLLGGSAFNVYKLAFERSKTIANNTISGTYEILLDNALWKACREILRGSYSKDFLVQKLIMVQAEVDYLLSLYGDR